MEALPPAVLWSLVALFGGGLLFCAHQYLKNQKDRDKLFQLEMRKLGSMANRTLNMLTVQQEHTKTLFKHYERHEAHLQRHDESIVRLRAQRN